MEYHDNFRVDWSSDLSTRRLRSVFFALIGSYSKEVDWRRPVVAEASQECDMTVYQRKFCQGFGFGREPQIQMTIFTNFDLLLEEAVLLHFEGFFEFSGTVDGGNSDDIGK